MYRLLHAKPMLASMLLVAVLIWAVSAVPTATATKPEPMPVTCSFTEVQVKVTKVTEDSVFLTISYQGLAAVPTMPSVPLPFSGSEAARVSTADGKGNFNGEVLIDAYSAGAITVKLRGKILAMDPVTYAAEVEGSYTVVKATGMFEGVKMVGKLDGTVTEGGSITLHGMFHQEPTPTP